MSCVRARHHQCFSNSSRYRSPYFGSKIYTECIVRAMPFHLGVDCRGRRNVDQRESGILVFSYIAASVAWCRILIATGLVGDAASLPMSLPTT
jgi:hypothetical protein